MDLALQIGFWGGVVPAATALALGLVLGRLSPWPWSRRYALPVALAGSFALGYVLLPDWAALAPERHWQWLPWLGLAAAVVAGVRLADGLAAGERWLLAAMLAVAVAWFIVPTWPDLQPTRPWGVALLTGYVTLLALALEELPDQLRGPLYCVLLTMVTAGLGATIAAAYSLKYGQLAGIAAAGLAGCCLAMLRSESGRAVRGLGVVYAVLVGGIAYVGYVEPSPPLRVALLIPAAPLALWLCAAGPLARLTGWRSAIVQAAIVLVPVVIAVGWKLVNESANDGY